MMNNNDTIDSNGGPEGDAITPIQLVRAVGLRKSFPGVQAIADGSFELRAGEIHALVGENGAGKSTMIKILTGVHRPDRGQLFIDSAERKFDSPIASQQLGITAIYQEFTLVPVLSVVDNLFLGREIKRVGLIDRGLQKAKTEEVLARLGTSLDPDSAVSSLSVSEQQLVEIARALVSETRVLIMDEPTAALTPREVNNLFDILRDLAGQGIGIIFVSHRLNEVLELSNRVTVMRDGITVGTKPTSHLSRNKLIELMVGRSLENEFPRGENIPGPVCLEIKHLSGGTVRDVSFYVRKGEILGISGLMGAGRTEMARLIFGADDAESGEIVLDEKSVSIGNPREAIDAGICLLNEDRKGQGLVLCASALENFALPNLKRWSRYSLLNLLQEAKAFDDKVQSLAIKIANPRHRAENLSGGNQQKLLVARWLEADSKVIVFDEPTRGIDVGAKYEMYLIMQKLAAEGKGLIMISSELPEILGMCDRILVMKNGRISGEIIDVGNATQEDIMSMAV